MKDKIKISRELVRMMQLTAKELYSRSLEHEAMWTQQAMESEVGSWNYRFSVGKMVRERILQNYLKTIPMDKVLHDGTGHSREYDCCLQIVNS